ncbi:hypothetical protein HMPREF1505_1733 [Prevotella sp. ICM33]|nr:hypothetical protein HMPREF1494_2187 [Bifidobacterium sp. MSTE12]ETS96695.1 hypothetical protein HMPREF1505_1733 [Prevotella sp. ICM33]
MHLRLRADVEGEDDLSSHIGLSGHRPAREDSEVLTCPRERSDDVRLRLGSAVKPPDSTSNGGRHCSFILSSSLSRRSCSRACASCECSSMVR